MIEFLKVTSWLPSFYPWHAVRVINYSRLLFWLLLLSWPNRPHAVPECDPLLRVLQARSVGQWVGTRVSCAKRLNWLTCCLDAKLVFFLFLFLVPCGRFSCFCQRLSARENEVVCRVVRRPIVFFRHELLTPNKKNQPALYAEVTFFRLSSAVSVSCFARHYRLSRLCQRLMKEDRLMSAIDRFAILHQCTIAHVGLHV